MDFSKHPVYALVDKNASGKSTLLDAINRAITEKCRKRQKENGKSVLLEAEFSASRSYKIRGSKGVYEPLPGAQQDNTPDMDGKALKPYQLSTSMQTILTMEAIINYPRAGEQDRVLSS